MALGGRKKQREGGRKSLWLLSNRKSLLWFLQDCGVVAVCWGSNVEPVHINLYVTCGGSILKCSHCEINRAAPPQKMLWVLKVSLLEHEDFFLDFPKKYKLSSHTKNRTISFSTQTQDDSLLTDHFDKCFCGSDSTHDGQTAEWHRSVYTVLSIICVLNSR